MPSSHPQRPILASLVLALVACGGTFTPADPGDAGTGGHAGTGGTGNTGGTSTGGTDGGVGGVAATGGTAGYGATGGTAGTWDGGACPPLPSCNWCDGINIYNEAGCVIAFQCANGVDPCATPACDPADPYGCGPGMHCADDRLCWPGSVCDPKTCTTPSWNCDCTWTCPDNNTYREYCVGTGSGSQSCECSVNGEVTHGCAENVGSAGGPGDWCGAPTCCGFPQ